jgi:hypothetical protein
MFVTAKKSFTEISRITKQICPKNMSKLSGMQHFSVTLYKILNFQQPTTVLNQTICYQNLFHHKLWYADIL